MTLHEDVIVCCCLPMREDEQYGCRGLSIRLWLAPKGGVGESTVEVGVDLMMCVSKWEMHMVGVMKPVQEMGETAMFFQGLL
ncbi:unnamed protein product [Trifolium pratense]|uniref:Uncharacterized protein n=1 Tax=Trifolium pratense TaxID=57577 RepID=A0ACB0K906_TRIPR|nr:unnamed protein product [Trifolium pratense]